MCALCACFYVDPSSASAVRVLVCVGDFMVLVVFGVRFVYIIPTLVENAFYVLLN